MNAKNAIHFYTLKKFLLTTQIFQRENAHTNNAYKIDIDMLIIIQCIKQNIQRTLDITLCKKERI